MSHPEDVVRPANKPLLATGGVVGLKGNLAPEGAIVKVAGMAGLKFTGPARCFDREEACFEAVRLPFCSALARGHCGLVPTAATLQCRHSIGMFSLLSTRSD